MEKYFEDSMLVAAHAHRVTLMVKDFNTLSRVRWRYDKLLHPVEWQDFRMRDILLIPSTRKSKVDEVTHSKNIRGKAAYKESLKQQKAKSKSVIDLETVQMELQIQRKLQELGPNIVVHIEDEVLVNNFHLTKQCLVALAIKNEYCSDTIILAML